ncbi:restriction endonuclease subunit S [Empedobacter falsenii]
MEFVKLGDVVDIKTGKLDVNAENPNGKYPFFTCSKKHTYIDDYAFDGEYILVAGNGDLNVKYYLGKFNAYQRTYVIKPSNTIDGKYLYYFLETYLKILRNQSIGGVIKYIKLGNLTEALIPLPSLEVQKAIAARLDKADQIRQLNQQIINHYDELIQALFIDMFGDPVKNEKGWEKSIIGEVCSKIQIGPFGSQLHQSDYVDNGLPLINPVNIKKDKIDLLNSVKITQEKYDELPNYHLRIHDIILARRGDLSKIGYIRNENNFCGTGSLFIRLKSNLNSFFIFKLLNHTSTINYLYENAQGVTMPNLNKKIVYNIPIFLPPIELQNQFAERVEKIEAQKELAVQALQQSEDLFNSLLQQAFKK